MAYDNVIISKFYQCQLIVVFSVCKHISLSFATVVFIVSAAFLPNHLIIQKSHTKIKGAEARVSACHSQDCGKKFCLFPNSTPLSSILSTLK